MGSIHTVKLMPGPKSGLTRGPKTVNAGSPREVELRAAGWVDWSGSKPVAAPPPAPKPAPPPPAPKPKSVDPRTKR